MEKNGPSRHKDIESHLNDLIKQGDLQLNSSVKTWGKYLKEAVKTGFITKGDSVLKKDGTPGEYSLYAMPSQVEQEKRMVGWNEEWIKTIREIVKKTKEEVDKLDDEKLGNRIYSVYTLLIDLLARQRIYQEFSQTKHLRELKKMVRNTIPEITNELFMILDELEEGRKDSVIREILYEWQDDGLSWSMIERYVGAMINSKNLPNQIGPFPYDPNFDAFRHLGNKPAYSRHKN